MSIRSTGLSIVEVAERNRPFELQQEERQQRARIEESANKCFRMNVPRGHTMAFLKWGGWSWLWKEPPNKKTSSYRTQQISPADYLRKTERTNQKISYIHLSQWKMFEPGASTYSTAARYMLAQRDTLFCVSIPENAKSYRSAIRVPITHYRR